GRLEPEVTDGAAANAVERAPFRHAIDHEGGKRLLRIPHMNRGVGAEPGGEQAAVFRARDDEGAFALMQAVAHVVRDGLGEEFALAIDLHEVILGGVLEKLSPMERRVHYHAGWCMFLQAVYAAARLSSIVVFSNAASPFIDARTRVATMAFTGRWSEARSARAERCALSASSAGRGRAQTRSSAKRGQREGNERSTTERPSRRLNQRRGRLKGNHSLMSPSTTRRSSVFFTISSSFLTCQRRSAAKRPRCVTMTRTFSPHTSRSTSRALRGSRLP